MSAVNSLLYDSNHKVTEPVSGNSQAQSLMGLGLYSVGVGPSLDDRTVVSANAP